MPSATPTVRSGRSSACPATRAKASLPYLVPRSSARVRGRRRGLPPGDAADPLQFLFDSAEMLLNGGNARSEIRFAILEHAASRNSLGIAVGTATFVAPTW